MSFGDQWKPSYSRPPAQTFTFPWPVQTWQRCPVCEGCGTVPADFYLRLGSATSTSRQQCKTCEGHGIVAVANGLPPVSGVLSDKPGENE